MKTLCVKASSAPGTLLLVRQRTDNKGLQAMLLYHREHRWWSVGPAALQRDADPLLRASWASSGVPNVPVPPRPATQCSSRIPSWVTGQAQLPLMGPQIYWKSWRLPRYPQDLGWAGASAPGQAASPPTQRGGELRPSYTPSPPLAVRRADFKHWFI